jgi:hypothetical protein
LCFIFRKGVFADHSLPDHFFSQSINGLHRLNGLNGLGLLEAGQAKETTFGNVVPRTLQKHGKPFSAFCVSPIAYDIEQEDRPSSCLGSTAKQLAIQPTHSSEVVSVTPND